VPGTRQDEVLPHRWSMARRAGCALQSARPAVPVPNESGKSAKRIRGNESADARLPAPLINVY
jgi:hypothetical protein